MSQKKIIYYLIIANLVLIFFYLLGKFSIIHEFIKVIVGVILIPIIFGVFLFYIFRPLNNLFLKKNMKKSRAAMLTLTIVFFVLGGIGKFLSEYFFIQILNLKDFFFNIVENEEIKNIVEVYIKNETIKGIAQNLCNELVGYINLLLANMKNIFDMGLMIFSGVLLVILIVFFLLRDGDQFKIVVLKYCQDKYKDLVSKILKEGDEVLSTYVIGQATVALALSTMVFIGYKIIKMPSALILASTTFLLAFIPFVGFFISMIIPYIIAIVLGINMVIKLSVLLVIAQTLKGRVVVPFIMGKAMKIHPITDIFLVVGGASIGGPLLAFCIVPIYSLVKVVIKNIKIKGDYVNNTNIDKKKKV